MADKTDPEINVDIDEDDVISSDNAYSHQRRRGFLKLFVYFLIALAFAALVVLLGRWVYHKVNKNETDKPQTTSNPATPAPATPPANSTNTNSQNNTPSSSSSPNSAPQTAGQVPNTGPGNVIALFIGTAVIVGGLHYVVSLRRA